MKVIFDIEADGLLDDVTKIHCFSYTENQSEVKTLTDYDDIRKFLSNPNLELVGHNIIQYDIPVLEKILDIKITNRLIDTLALSWYLYPNRDKHGLELWGEEFGVPKPKIDDWHNLSQEEYIHRCEEDVKINTKLYINQQLYLKSLYGTLDPPIVNYLAYKLDCAREQREVKWKLDIELCKKTLENFEKLKLEKQQNLIKVMPPVPVYSTKNKPKRIFSEKTKTLTALGKNWFSLLESQGLPYTHEEPVKIIKGYKEPNPNSTSQKKDWLLSLGWIPDTFEYVKDKDTGIEKEVPQIYNKDKEVCDSVKALYDICPDVENLDSYSLLSHRIGILKGFLENVDEEGYLRAEIRGFTNTLRFKHTTLVNLPKITKPFSKDLRACLIAPSEDHLLCGSDMSSLEDNTKKHYMWAYDPGYVTEMSRPGYDPHLGIGIFANLITNEEVEFFKRIGTLLENKAEVSLQDKEKYKDIGVKRSLSKTVNFAGVYGAGPAKIAKSSGMSLNEAKKLHKAYWDLNWSVKQIGRDAVHKTVNEQMWLYNPVSRFWYSLRYEKDKFSTLNQGTGVFCFDSWVREVRKLGYRICGQFHDEIIIPFKKGQESQIASNLTKAIENVNENLKLNVKLGVSIQSGSRYSEIH